MAFKHKLISLLTLFFLALLTGPSLAFAEDSHINYSAALQGGTWTNELSDGAVCGTVGQAVRLESVKFSLSGSDGSGVEYQAHIEDLGWSVYASNGQQCGDPNSTKRIEAVRVKLTGPAAEAYDIYYSVHVSDIGWMDWAKNNETAGTTGYGKSVEAFKAVIVPKGGAAPGPVDRPCMEKGANTAGGVTYKCCLIDGNWMPDTANGATAGTVGKGEAISAVSAKLENIGGEVQYNAHVENTGWLSPVKDGAVIGDPESGLQIEALQFVLAGQAGELYDIYYRTHVSDYGWLGWACNGAQAGSAGGSKAVEAFEISLVPKGSPAPGSTSGAFLDLTKPILAAPSNTGALQVKGSTLVGQTGEPVQLKGVSTHGLSWFPQYVNEQLFNELKNEWNANVVRLAMYTAEYNGYCTGGDKNALKDLVRKGVDYASKADMYAIVDWHVLNDCDPNTYKAEAIEFFDTMSAEFAGKDNVIYEICNEPNGSATWAGIKAYAQEVIPVIRAHDSDAVIIVGTPTWSQRVDEALASPIEGYGNIMYALHFYAGTHKEDLRRTMVNAVQGGLPVFVSEFGISDASGNGGLDIDSGNEWIRQINALGLSYVCWNLSNKAESSALIKSDCQKVAGFERSDLSGHGQWLLDVLKSPGLVGNPGAPQEPVEPQKPETPDVEQNNGNLNYSLKLVNSWESGNEHFYQLVMSIANTGNEDVNSWSGQVNFNQPITLTGSWNGVYEAGPDTLRISNMDYNASIPAGESVGDIGFIVKSGANLNYSLN